MKQIRWFDVPEKLRGPVEMFPFILCTCSNIQSFCGYIKQLPSLETKVAKKKVHQTRQCKDGDV